MTNIRVAIINVPSATTVGLFSSSGISPSSYEVRIQYGGANNSISIVDSAAATSVGYLILAGYQPDYGTTGLKFETDGSEIYLYNSYTSAVSVGVLLSPIIRFGPASSSTTFTY